MFCRKPVVYFIHKAKKKKNTRRVVLLLKKKYNPLVSNRISFVQWSKLEAYHTKPRP